MADPFTIAAVGSAGLGVVGSILGGIFGSEAAEAQKKAALERARRQNASNMATLGQTRANAAASGVDSGAGSAASYLAAMAEEFRRENDWDVLQAYKGADLAGASNMLNVFTGIGSSLFSFGNAMNWGREPPAPMKPQSTPFNFPGLSGAAPTVPFRLP